VLWSVRLLEVQGVLDFAGADELNVLPEFLHGWF
jgi:hypothetical protein